MPPLKRQLRADLSKWFEIQQAKAEVEKAEFVLSQLLQANVHGIRLRRLLAALSRTEQLRIQLYEWSKSGLEGTSFGKISNAPNNRRELAALLEEIELALKKYPLRTSVIADSDYFSLGKRSIWLGNVNADDRREALVADILVHYATDGSQRSPASILKFRNCRLPECSRLFWAPASRKDFCSPTCRKKFHAMSPRSKKQRAMYMKRYREDEKERNRLKEEAYKRGWKKGH